MYYVIKEEVEGMSKYDSKGQRGVKVHKDLKYCYVLNEQSIMHYDTIVCCNITKVP